MNFTRRTFLKAGSISPALFNIARGAAPTDIRIEDIRLNYQDYSYRVPIKFGGTVLDRATILNVDCVVRTANGRTGKGFGSMPLANAWSFPSRKLSFDVTLNAMNSACPIKAVSPMDFQAEMLQPVEILMACRPPWCNALPQGTRQE